MINVPSHQDEFVGPRANWLIWFLTLTTDTTKYKVSFTVQWHHMMNSAMQMFTVDIYCFPENVHLDFYE